MDEQMNRRASGVPCALTSAALLAVAAVAYFAATSSPSITDGEAVRHAWRGGHLSPFFFLLFFCDLTLQTLVGAALGILSVALPALLRAVAARLCEAIGKECGTARRTGGPMAGTGPNRSASRGSHDVG